MGTLQKRLRDKWDRDVSRGREKLSVGARSEVSQGQPESGREPGKREIVRGEAPEASQGQTGRGTETSEGKIVRGGTFRSLPGTNGTGKTTGVGKRAGEEKDKPGKEIRKTGHMAMKLEEEK